jgi:homoserine dehydrogenase
MQDLRVGVIGFGTVGAGVVECIQQNGELIGARTGIRPTITRIADLDITTDRGVTVPDGVLTTDANAVLNGDDVDVVVELVGGTTIAKTFILQALANGKHVVTANKALLAYHGGEIFAAAEAAGTEVYYEASVAGGIPIIKSLREGFAGNQIEAIYGIMNGTCNYILTRMENEGLAFDGVLDEAQRLGYAEAEPSLDIDGDDTAHKTTVLAALAYGHWYGMDSIHVEGIRGIALEDIRNAAEAGYKIKLLAVIKKRDEGIEMRVHPTLVPENSMIAKVSDVFNAVSVVGDTVGETMSYGRGAGREATASAVVADIIDVGLNLAHDSIGRVPAFRGRPGNETVVAMNDVVTRFYLRLQVTDRPCTLSRITDILGQAGISIASFVQRECDNEAEVPVTLITHEAREVDLQKALTAIRELDVVQGEPVLMRIEDV